MGKPWTHEEIALLDEAYKNKVGKDLTIPDGLSNRSVTSIWAKARRLGIGKSCLKVAPWTRKDVSILKQAYYKRPGKGSIEYPPELLKHHTAGACKAKVHKLGIADVVHSCWEHGTIISSQINKTWNKSARKKVTDGMWRYRECRICGVGWETLEKKRRNVKPKLKRDNRLRPLSEGWKP